VHRRDFITMAAAAALLRPGEGRAESAATPVVGFLSGRSPSESSDLVASFRKGLRQMGLVEGQNVALAFRWADGRYERLQALAMELVQLPVAVLFAAGGTPAALAAKAATSTIPVVVSTTDPVGLGLVASLSHPGGNITGISNLASDLPSKSIELLKQLIPSAKVIAYLVNPTNPSAALHAERASLAATALDSELRLVRAGTPQALTDAFAEIAEARIAALGVMADAFFDSQHARIVELSARDRIVGCYPWRDYVTAGGMMSYGTNLLESYRQAGLYVGRILRGEKPSDLPVMQATKIELVLNLKTAKALGIVVPPTLLAIADDVIE
jgi:putative ABC transport system substrate-binding protein